MTTPSTGARRATKLATRNALIEAALAEFIEHGPATPSLDAICERAGFTRGAFYVHFADREQLLVAVMDRALGDLLRSIVAEGSTADDGLAGGIRYFTRAAAGQSPAVHPDRGLRFHHVLEACRTSRAIGDRYRSILTAAAAWAASHRRGRLSPLEPKVAGEIVIAAGLGLLVLLELGVPVDPQRLGDAMISALELEPRKRSRRARRRP